MKKFETDQHALVPTDVACYGKYYSSDKFWVKLRKIGRKAGQKVIYSALQLYFAVTEGNLSFRDKLLITGALGYFILPLDFLPDFLLPLGFTDDLGVLIFVIEKVKKQITPAIRLRAKQQLAALLGENSEVGAEGE